MWLVTQIRPITSYKAVSHLRNGFIAAAAELREHERDVIVTHYSSEEGLVPGDQTAK